MGDMGGKPIFGVVGVPPVSPLKQTLGIKRHCVIEGDIATEPQPLSWL